MMSDDYKRSSAIVPRVAGGLDDKCIRQSDASDGEMETEGYRHPVKNRSSRSPSQERTSSVEANVSGFRPPSWEPRGGAPPSVEKTLITGLPLPSPELSLERSPRPGPSRVENIPAKRGLSRSPNDGISPPAKAVGRDKALTISDESDVEFVPTSDRTYASSSCFSGGVSASGARSAKGIIPLRSKKKKKALTVDPINLSFDELPEMNMEDIASVDIGGAAFEWLDQLDQLRAKSGNLQGKVSGQMRVRILKLKEVIEIFTVRLETKGDVAHLRRTNESLKQDSFDHKKRMDDLNKELRYAEGRIGDLQGEIRKLKENRTSGRDDRHRPSLPKGIQTSPGLGSTVWDAAETSNPPLGVATSGFIHQTQSIRKLDNRIAELTHLMEDIKRSVADAQTDEVRDMTGLGNRRPSRSGPRIVENVQLVPPRSVRRPRRRKQETSEFESGVRSESEMDSRTSWPPTNRPRLSARDDPPHPDRVAWGDRGAGVSYSNKLRAPPPASLGGGGGGRRRPPKTAAVAIRIVKEDMSFADVIRRARSEIPLDELGISDSRIRKSANGNLIIEIPGPDGSDKADLLTSKMRSVFREDTVVTRQTMRGDLRLVGLDDSISIQEITEAILLAGDCPASSIKVGTIRKLRNGQGVVWAQCPLTAANRISATGKLRIGWSTVRVVSLGIRPTQCFRCLEFGHVRGNCRSETDRSGHCFRCGGLDHKVGECLSPPLCVLCRDKSLDHSHWMGSSRCGSRSVPAPAPRWRTQRPPGGPVGHTGDA